MDVWVYQAELLCKACAANILADCRQFGPEDKGRDFYTDSDKFPQGPYDQGGGEADTPQHCGDCGRFLENPLTEAGELYVQAAAESHMGSTFKPPEVLEWMEFYSYLFPLRAEGEDQS